MNNTFRRLVALSGLVVTICGTSLAIRDYNSEYSVIKAGISKLEEVANYWKQQYNTLVNDLDSVEGTLAQVEAKLKSIYAAITGNQYNADELGPIMDFDFSTIIKDTSYNNNLNAEVICNILGIPVDSSDEVIIAEIEALVEQVKTLEQQIEEYKAEEQSLVSELNSFKERLDAALEEANNKIDTANQEELNVINDLNTSLENVGSDYRVSADGVVEEETPVEPEVDELAEAEAAMTEAWEILNVSDSEADSEYARLLQGKATLEDTGTKYRLNGQYTINISYSEEAHAFYQAYQTWASLK